MHSNARPLSGQKRVLDEPTLVVQLNLLLTSLNLPIPLISPTDLTPSLLIAILESILGMRIPLINNKIEYKQSKASKIQNMKIFLGVLETDILQKDVGLSHLDPRKLADGEWEEVLYIAELLCWIGRRMGYIPRHAEKGEESTFILPPQRKVEVASLSRTMAIRPPSPKSQLDIDAESIFQGDSTVTGSAKKSQQTFSPFISPNGWESVTSLNTGDHEDDVHSQDNDTESISDILSALSPFTQPTRLPPQCIHEVPSPSVLFSLDLPVAAHPKSKASTRRTLGEGDCDVSLYNTTPIEHDYIGDRPHSSVRYDGFIEPVDEDMELVSFENSRSISLGNNTKEKVKFHSHPIHSDILNNSRIL